MGNTAVTASVDDINKIAGLTDVSATQFGYLSGLTGDIQTQLTADAARRCCMQKGW